MSKHQRRVRSRSASMARRASSTASQNASAAIPRVTDEYGVRVSSAYRTFWSARPTPMSWVSVQTSSGVRIRSTTER